MPTIDEMIKNAVFGGQEYEDPTEVKIASARPPAQNVSEAEKIATTLEFIGRRGVENLVKEASGFPPPGTNHGVHHGNHRQSTVKHHSKAPPMNDGGRNPATNANHTPGGSGEQAKPRGDGQTRHPALSSNSAAINYDKREKARQVSSDLSALFNAKPFADGKLKENLTGAAGKGDKNINVKTAADREQIRAALAKKLAHQGV